LSAQASQSCFLAKCSPRPERFVSEDAKVRREVRWRWTPTRRWPRAQTAKFSGERWPKFQDPSRHSFVGDIQAALREHIFDVTIAEGEAEIESDEGPAAGRLWG
jgi:hypothetical protein